MDGGWSFFVNHRGYMGITPSDAKYDDDLFIAPGSPAPFILRKSEAGYKFVGEAYVHGLMDGEAFGMLEAGEIHAQIVDLI